MLCLSCRFPAIISERGRKQEEDFFIVQVEEDIEGKKQ
jgi:hypothetical protein